jgi:hypothetical protein
MSMEKPHAKLAEQVTLGGPLVPFPLAIYPVSVERAESGLARWDGRSSLRARFGVRILSPGTR